MPPRPKTSLRYTFIFSGIRDHLTHSKVKVINEDTAERTTLYVSMNETDFLTRRGLRISAPLADINDLAVAIQVADRWAKRDREYPCRIRVKLPVRQPDILSAVNVLEHLERMLYWFTGDQWILEFVPISEDRRRSELQCHLWESSNIGVKAEVALWSGGLDAFAGLCCRVRDHAADRYLLIGEGSNSPMKGIQERVFTRLKDRLDADLERVTIAAVKSREKGEKKLQKNSWLRSRGLVFMLLGCAYACLEGQRALAVYENGIGAINLPFRASEVGLEHTRSVHPLSMRYVSQFVSMLIGEPFLVHNPFLWSTKAEMCRVLDELDVIDIAWETVSCDRPHRNHTPQCGRCSSCLLRRQSFLASDTLDETGYLILSESCDSRDQLLRTSQLAHMLFQAQTLSAILATPDSWARLAHQHPTRLADMVQRLSEDGSENYDSLVRKVLSLYQRYTAEWMKPAVHEHFAGELEAMRRIPQREESGVRKPEEGTAK